MDDKKEIEVLARSIKLLYDYVEMDIIESSGEKPGLISQKISSYDRRLNLLKYDETIKALKLRLAEA